MRHGSTARRGLAIASLLGIVILIILMTTLSWAGASIDCPRGYKLVSTSDKDDEEVLLSPERAVQRKRFKPGNPLINVDGPNWLRSGRNHHKSKIPDFITSVRGHPAKKGRFKNSRRPLKRFKCVPIAPKEVLVPSQQQQRQRQRQRHLVVPLSVLMGQLGGRPAVKVGQRSALVLKPQYIITRPGGSGKTSLSRRLSNPRTNRKKPNIGTSKKKKPSRLPSRFEVDTSLLDNDLIEEERKLNALLAPKPSIDLKTLNPRLPNILTENQLIAYPDDEMDMVRPEYIFPKPLDPSLINMGVPMGTREEELHPALALEAKRREAALTRPHVDVVGIQQQKSGKVRPVPVIVDPATMTSVGDNFHGYHLVKDLKGDCAKLFLNAAAALTPKVEDPRPDSHLLGGIVDASDSDFKRIMKEETDGGVSSFMMERKAVESPLKLSSKNESLASPSQLIVKPKEASTSKQKQPPKGHGDERNERWPDKKEEEDERWRMVKQWIHQGQEASKTTTLRPRVALENEKTLLLDLDGKQVLAKIVSNSANLTDKTTTTTTTEKEGQYAGGLMTKDKKDEQELRSLDNDLSGDFSGDDGKSIIDRRGTETTTTPSLSTLGYVTEWQYYNVPAEEAGSGLEEVIKMLGGGDGEIANKEEWQIVKGFNEGSGHLQKEEKAEFDESFYDNVRSMEEDENGNMVPLNLMGKNALSGEIKLLEDQLSSRTTNHHHRRRVRAEHHDIDVGVAELELWRKLMEEERKIK